MNKPVKVWDWSIRVFHWCLPLLLFLLWFSATQSQNFDALEHHMLIAQILMGLLIYRVIWGFIGTPAARFSRFLVGPKTLIEYTQSVLTRKPLHYVGHNPLGGLMVIVLLGAVGFQLLTGLYTSDDILYSGPLYSSASRDTTSWMASWHHRFFDYILILVGLHLLAILIHKLMGEGLVKAMFTGTKPSEGARDIEKLEPEPTSFPWIRFVIAMVLALASVAYIFYV